MFIIYHITLGSTEYLREGVYAYHIILRSTVYLREVFNAHLPFFQVQLRKSYNALYNTNLDHELTPPPNPHEMLVYFHDQCT